MSNVNKVKLLSERPSLMTPLKMKKKTGKLSLISAKLDIYMILLSVNCFVQNKLFKLKFWDSSKIG